MSDARVAPVSTQQVTEAVIQLAGVAVHSALRAEFGPPSDPATTVRDLVNNPSDLEIDALTRRKASRFVEECVDVTANQTLRFLEDHTAGMFTEDIVAAIDAVTALYAESTVNLQVILESDVNARLLYQNVEHDVAAIRDRAGLQGGADRLFGELSREVAEYIVQLATAVPEFSIVALSQILRQNSQIIERLSEAMQRMPRQRSEDAFTTDYLRAVANKFDRMELFGVDASNASTRYPLSVAYMSLAVTARSANGAPSLSSGSGDTFHQIAHGHRRILVVGEAGSGKTTLLRWLAVNSAREPAASPSRPLNRPSTTRNKVPFLIPLRRYSGKPLPRPEEFLEVVASNFTADMAPGWVQERLRLGEALVLIDGLDELEEHQRTTSMEWLEELMEDFGKSTYVLTSRPAALSGMRSEPGLYQVELQPMSETDVRDFIKKWHTAVQGETSTPDEREKLANDERSMYAALSADRNIRSLAVNPLLCALLCALNRESSGSLPTRRMEVYEASMSMLLRDRNRRRGVVGGLDVPKSSQMIVLGALALWMMREGLASASRERTLACIKRVTPQLPAEASDPEKLLTYLLVRSGLLGEPAEGQIDFIHRSFQEYLAGLTAIENDEVGDLLSKATEDTWREVILVAIAHAHLDQRTQLLRGLLELARAGADKRVSFLAVAGLQNAPGADPELRDAIEKLARDLVPPRDMVRAESLAGVGDLVIEVLNERKPADDISGAATVRLLSMIASRDAMNLIAQIGEQQAGHRTQFEIIRAWSAFDRPEYARFVVARACQMAELEVTDPDLLPYTGYFATITRLMLDPGRLVNLRRLGERPPNLSSLKVRRAPRTNVEGIEDWNGIEDLTIECVNTVVDLVPVSGLSSLKELRLIVQSGVSATVQLGPLRRLGSLTTVVIEGDERVTTNFLGLGGMHGVSFHLPEGSRLLAENQIPEGSRITWERWSEGFSVSSRVQIPRPRA